MPVLPSRSKLEQMIEVAMKDSAPAMHRELRKSGELPKVLRERAMQAEDSYEAAMSQVTTRALRASRELSHQETVSELMQGRSEAARIAIDQAVEFAPSETNDLSHS